MVPNHWNRGRRSRHGAGGEAPTGFVFSPLPVSQLLGKNDGRRPGCAGRISDSDGERVASRDEGRRSGHAGGGFPNDGAPRLERSGAATIRVPSPGIVRGDGSASHHGGSLRSCSPHGEPESPGACHSPRAGRRTRQGFAHGCRAGDAARVLGLGLGLGAALSLSRFLSSLLFEIGPADPVTFIAATVIVVGVTALACWIPACRIARIDPMAALRCG